MVLVQIALEFHPPGGDLIGGVEVRFDNIHIQHGREDHDRQGNQNVLFSFCDNHDFSRSTS